MATFAEEMVTKLETVLKANAGLKSVQVDGQAVSFDDITDQYDYWKRKVAKEKGRAPVISTIKLGQF